MAWEYIQEKDHMNLYLLYLFLTMGHFRPLFGYLSFQLYNQNENKIHQKFQETGELPQSGLWATQTFLSSARRTCGTSSRNASRCVNKNIILVFTFKAVLGKYTIVYKVLTLELGLGLSCGQGQARGHCCQKIGKVQKSSLRER